MHYQKDWILREIEMLAHFIVVNVFGKDTQLYELIGEDVLDNTDVLHKEILACIKNKDICRAEDMLFRYIDSDSLADKIVKVSLDFYTRINKFTDDELEQVDFSRKEIADGLRDISKKLGIPDISYQSFTK